MEEETTNERTLRSPIIDRHLWLREAKREGAKDTEFIRKLHDSIPRDSWLEKQVVSFASFHLAHFLRADDWTGDMLLWLDNKIMIKTGIGLKYVTQKTCARQTTL